MSQSDQNDPRNTSVGRADFVQRHGLWTAEQEKAAEEVIRQVADSDLEIIRFSFPDQHGILRGKSVMADEFAQVMRNGCGVTTTLLAKDTSHKTVFPVFTEGGGFGLQAMSGAADVMMVADPTCFRVLPWAEKTGWVLCDLYFQSGEPVPFATRHIMRDALRKLDGLGYEYIAGLEVEFHIYRLEDPMLQPEHAGQPAEAPKVSLITHGFNYLTEARLDEADPVMQIIRRQAMELCLPLRTVESEFGPSQVEMTFHPGPGLQSADTMMLFRSMVKQVAHRNGYHATFMCKPQLENAFASGWHLHQSLRDKKTGANLFIPERDEDLLSPLGRQFVAGILEHAVPASVFTTPTINGYKRYKPMSLAPERISWGRDNKAAMLRSVGGAGDGGSRLENRVGDPAANPYLYMTSQILSGLDGIERGLEPPDPNPAPYFSEDSLLPSSLMDAVAALKSDQFFREAMGDLFIDYLLTIKEAEIERFLSTVTEWEQREYFEIF